MTKSFLPPDPLTLSERLVTAQQHILATAFDRQRLLYSRRERLASTLIDALPESGLLDYICVDLTITENWITELRITPTVHVRIGWRLVKGAEWWYADVIQEDIGATRFDYKGADDRNEYITHLKEVCGTVATLLEGTT